MMKCVFKVVGLSHNDQKTRLIKMVCSVTDVESISVDQREMRLTVVGQSIDPVEITRMIRKKFGYAMILSVEMLKAKKGGNVEMPNKKENETSGDDPKRAKPLKETLIVKNSEESEKDDPWESTPQLQNPAVGVSTTGLTSRFPPRERDKDLQVQEGSETKQTDFSSNEAGQVQEWPDAEIFGNSDLQQLFGDSRSSQSQTFDVSVLDLAAELPSLEDTKTDEFDQRGLDTGGTKTEVGNEMEGFESKGEVTKIFRCPKCRKLLPSLYSLFQCGGCGAVLQGKSQSKPDEQQLPEVIEISYPISYASPMGSLFSSPEAGPFISTDLSQYKANKNTNGSVAIKASYGEDIIRFHFPSGHGIVELKEELANRLELDTDAFVIKYLDNELDWVLITCDADVRECMDIMRSSESQLLRISVLDKLVRPRNSAGEIPETKSQIQNSDPKGPEEQLVAETIYPQSRNTLSETEIDQVEAETIKRSTEHAFPHLVPSAGRLASMRKDAEGAHGRSELGMHLKRSIKEGVVRISALINDVTTKRLGIYGQGGIGKTSVLRALITNPETANRFDLIIFVTVSRNWNTRKIQVEIARQLQLCLDGMETDGQIAGKLFESLEGQRFLLILDDVWELIDFDAVGVPEPSKDVGCRILIASRSLEVCHEMVTDKEIELEGISKEEAWELFHEELDELIDAVDIYPLALALVEECAGLPLIIIVTGKALRNETDAEVWKHALESFRSSESVLPRLKFSYNRLNPLERRFFLYGALYPEDQEVNVCNLVDCCIEEGFILGESEDAHLKGHEIVNFLENAGFLEIQAGGGSVKMHDMMKDLASWILSCDVEGCQFLIGTDFRMRQPTDEGSSSLSMLPSNSGLRTLSFLNNGEILLRAGAADRRQPTEEEWKKASMMYLMDNEVSTLPKCPYSPNLRVLFLQRNYSIRVIPTSFFELMPSLQVLNLSRTRIKSLPRSFYNLISLRVLILRDCERFFMLPADVGSLIKLEILDLQGTNISHLPDALGQLSCLKQLKVSFYGSDNNSDYLKLAPDLIPRKVMSRLQTLEKLGIFVYPGDRRWDKRIEPLLQEVANLSQLTALSLSFPETDLLELFLQVSIAWQSKRMNTFNFVVGHDVNRIVARVSADVEFVHEKQERCLRYVNGDGITPDAVSEVLKRCTAFYLDHHLNIISLSEFGISNIKWLKVCVVSQCPEIQTIIDCKDRGGAILPSLERLSIHYLWNLRRIWREAVPSGSFRSLKILSVYSCPRLKYVFSYSMLQYAHNLEELVVEDCPEVTEVIVEDEGAASSDKPSTSLTRLTLHHLPELVSVWKGPWPLLEHISMFNCCKLKKIGLDSKLRYTIKEIKAEKDWWDALDWQEEEDLFSHLQSCFTPISDDDL